MQHLPVTLKALRATEIGKTVNKLKKESDNEIMTRSTEIVKQWMLLLETGIISFLESKLILYSIDKKLKPASDKRKIVEKKKDSAVSPLPVII